MVNVTRSRYNRIRMAKPHTLCLTPTHTNTQTHACVNYGYLNYTNAVTLATHAASRLAGNKDTPGQA